MQNEPATTEPKYTNEEIDHCISLMEFFVKNSEQFAFLTDEQKISFLTAAGQLSRPNRDEIRKRKKLVKRLERQIVTRTQRRARAETGIRSAREAKVF